MSYEKLYKLASEFEKLAQKQPARVSGPITPNRDMLQQQPARVSGPITPNKDVLPQPPPRVSGPITPNRDVLPQLGLQPSSQKTFRIGQKDYTQQQINYRAEKLISDRIQIDSTGRPTGFNLDNLSGKDRKMLLQSGYVTETSPGVLAPKPGVIQSFHAKKLAPSKTIQNDFKAINKGIDWKIRKENFYAALKNMGVATSLAAAKIAVITVPLYYLFTGVIPETDTYKAVSGTLSNMFGKKEDSTSSTEEGQSEIQNNSENNDEQQLDDLIAKYMPTFIKVASQSNILQLIDHMKTKMDTISSALEDNSETQASEPFSFISSKLDLMKTGISSITSLDFDSQTDQINKIIQSKIITPLNELSTSQQTNKAISMLTQNNKPNTANELKMFITNLTAEVKSTLNAGKSALDNFKQEQGQSE